MSIVNVEKCAMTSMGGRFAKHILPVSESTMSKVKGNTRPLARCCHRALLDAAKDVNPFGELPPVLESSAASTVKVGISFAQVVAGTPFVLAVRHPGKLLSFLGGLDIINISVTKVRGSH